MLCKLFGHKYKELAFNRYGLCSYRECKRCKKAFELDKEKHFGFTHIWKECEPIEFYDDGTKVEKE